MLSLKVIGDPKLAAHRLGTNRTLVEGQLLQSGSEDAMNKMAGAYPKLFELVGESSAAVSAKSRQEKADRERATAKAAAKPTTNKMLKKGSSKNKKKSKK